MRWICKQTKMLLLNLFCKIKDKDHNDSLEIKGKIRKRRGEIFQKYSSILTCNVQVDCVQTDKMFVWF